MKEKQTLIQNLTFMALMAAINMVFSLVAFFFPFASLFLTIALPMASVLVVLVCKVKYFPIYAVSTIGLSFLLTLSGPETTLFYVIPALASGFAFGFLIKRKVFAGFTVLGVAFLQLGLSYLLILLIKVLYETDMIVFFSTLLNISQSTFAATIMPSFFFVIALAQTAFSFIVIQSEIKKFGFEVNSEIRQKTLFPLLTLGTIFLIVGCAFFAPWISYLLLAVFIYFSMYSLVLLWAGRTQKLIIVWGILELLTLFLFAALFDWVEAPLSLLLIGIFFLPSNLLALRNLYFKNPAEKIK